MSLMKRNGNSFPFFPTFFDDVLSSSLFNWNNEHYSSTSTTIPSVNIRETHEHFEVDMAAPGMKKEDFKVELEGNTLTISSAKKQEYEDKREGYSRKEFSYQSFQRSFTLPKDVVDEDKIAAQYENGLLHLTIPKKEEARKKTPRLIEIS